jgi:hypothetical protein
MPQFPIRQQQAMLSGQGGQSFVDADAFGAGVYRAMGETAKAAVQIADNRAQERAATEMANTRIEWAKRLQDAQENPDTIGDDWNENIAGEYKKFIDEKAGTLGHFEAQHYRKAAMANMERVQLSALDIESRVVGQRKVAEFSAIAQDAQTLIVNDPHQFHDAVETIKLAAMGATGDSVLREKLVGEQTTKLFSIYADTLMQQGAEGARFLIEEIEGVGVTVKRQKSRVEEMDGATVTTYENELEEVESYTQGLDRSIDPAVLEAAKTRALRVLETDAIARRERLTSDVQEATKLNASGTFFDSEAYSLENLTAVYGKDRAAVIRTDLESAQDFARTYEALAVGNKKARDEALATAMANEEKAASPQERNNASANLEKVQRAYDTINEKWQKDPATMALDNPLVSGSLAKALTTGDSEAMRTYIDTSVAVQQENGVRSPRILTADLARGLRASLENSSGNGVEALNTLQQINATYGEHANRAILEAFGNERQARVFQQVNTLGDPDMQRNALIAMARAKENMAALTPAQKTTMEKAQAKVREQWTKSMVNDGDVTNDALFDMAGALYAHGIATSRDIDPEKVLISNRFDMYEKNGKTLRIPTAYNDSQVKRGVDAAIDWLSTSHDGVSMRSSYDGKKFTISNEDPEAFFQEGRTSIAVVASNDGKGFYFVSQSGNPIINKDGEPLRLSWEDSEKIYTWWKYKLGSNSGHRITKANEHIQMIMEQALGVNNAAQ